MHGTFKARLPIETLGDFSVDLHALALQEVGGVDFRSSDAADVLTSETGGYILLTAQPPGCFRAVALALDADSVSHWCSGSVGHCLPALAAQWSSPGFSLAALSSLDACLQPFARKGFPICVMGDFNVDFNHEDSGRTTAVLTHLRALGLDFFSYDNAPTWRDRRFDRVVCNSAVVCLCRHIGDHATCRWSVVEVRRDLQHALSVDHALLMHELLLFCPLPPFQQHNRARRRLAFLDRPCKMRVSNPSLLQQKVYAYPQTRIRFSRTVQCNALCELPLSGIGTPLSSGTVVANVASVQT